MEIKREENHKKFKLRQLGLIIKTLEYARPIKRLHNIPMNPNADIFAKTDQLSRVYLELEVLDVS